MDLVAKGQGVVTNNKMRLKSHVTHLPDRREREGEREVREGEEGGEREKEREHIKHPVSIHCTLTKCLISSHSHTHD